MTLTMKINNSRVTPWTWAQFCKHEAFLFILVGLMYSYILSLRNILIRTKPFILILSEKTPFFNLVEYSVWM